MATVTGTCVMGVSLHVGQVVHVQGFTPTSMLMLSVFWGQELISYRYSSCSSSPCCSCGDFVQRLSLFKSDRHEIWQDYSLSKYASIDLV